MCPALIWSYHWGQCDSGNYVVKRQRFCVYVWKATKALWRLKYNWFTIRGRAQVSSCSFPLENSFRDVRSYSYSVTRKRGHNERGSCIKALWRMFPQFCANLCLSAGHFLAPVSSRVKLAKLSAKLVANFRRSSEGDFRASFAGKIVRSILHQNSTANFTIKLHYAVLGCGGPYILAGKKTHRNAQKTQKRAILHRRCNIPRESFEVIFYLAGYFDFARLFLETLRKYPLKQAWDWHFQGYFDLARLFLPCKTKTKG